MAIEKHILEIIEGKKSAPLTKAILGALSQCYRAGVSLRNFAYDTFLPSARLDAIVISIGNIVAGGTGKTPFVQYLAERLISENFDVAILTRGYRRKGNKILKVNSTTSAEECGDEPLMLAQKLPKALVVVGKNRISAGRLVQRQRPFILLDDGMQYRKLERCFEIVVMDAGDLFGKGHYLPRGLLRDDPKRLSKADLIIINGVKDEEHLSSLTAQIRKFSESPITAMGLIVENSIELSSKKVGVFCAIAAPDRFMNTLKSLGCDIVLKEEKPDHFPFSEEEIERLANRALEQGAQCLVCTEKDAVKLPAKLSLALPLIPVKIALAPKFGQEHLEKIIKDPI